MGTRDVNIGSGGDSIVLLAKQPRWGSPVDDFTKFVQRRFVFTSNNIEPNPQFVQSDSTLGDGTAPPQILESVPAAGPLETELLPEDIVHLWAGAMNIQEDPTNTAKTSPATATDVLDTAAAWPSRIEVTLTGSAIPTGGASVTFAGTTKTGATSTSSGRETISVATGATTVTSTLFFTSDVTVTLNDFTTDGTPTYKYIPDTNDVSLNLGSLSGGLVAYTGQLRVGLTPVVVHNMNFNNTTLTMGNNVRLNIAIVASAMFNNRFANDIGTQATLWNDMTTTPALTDFPYINLNFARAQLTAVAMGDVNGKLESVKEDKPFETDNVVVGINNNLGESQRNTGNPSAGRPTVGDAGRQITLQIDKPYETGTDAYDWYDILNKEATVPIVVRSYIFNSQGRQYLIEHRMPACKLSGPPNRNIQGRGEIPISLQFDCSSQSGTPAIATTISSQYGFTNDHTA